MKTELTTEQSAHLIELGVPKEMASEVENGGAGNEVDKYIYTFTLTDLLEILPKEIKIPVMDEILEEPEYYIKYRIAFEWNSSDFGQTPPKYIAYYKEVSWVAHDTPFIKFKSDELIDALYELVCWYYEKFLKNKKNS